MADLTEAQASQSVKLAGAGPSSGIESNWAGVDSNGNLQVIQVTAGSVVAGTAASFSNLIGGIFNTALPSLTNGQQVALQVDSSGRLIIAPQTITVGVADKTAFTYGTTSFSNSGGVFQDTSPSLTAGQQGIVRLTGNRAFHVNLRDASGNEKLGSSTSANSIPVVIASDQSTIAISAASLPLPTGAATETTLAKLTLTQGSTTSGQSGPLMQGAVTTAAPAYTTAQTSPLSLTTSGGLRTDTSTLGGVAVSTGNGVAGTGSQRVVIASDNTAFSVNAIQSGTWTVQPGNTQNTTAWLVQDSADGPVTAGTVAAKSMLMGGQYNSTLPTLTTGQQAAVQVDSSGRLLVSGITADVAPSTVNITARDVASSTATGANNQSIITGSPTASSFASFAFTSEDAISLQVTGTWTGTLQAEVSLDSGTTWFIRPLNQTGTTIVSGTFTGNFTAICNVSGYTNFRIRSTAAMTGAATVKIIESVNPGAIYVANPLGISDAGGDSIAITANNDLQVVDIVNVSGQYRAQSVTTSAAEALGAATILANRKSLTITPTGGTVYWGYSNAVTTSTGTPIFKNQTASFAIGANVHIYLIAGSTIDCRITEGS